LGLEKKGDAHLLFTFDAQGAWHQSRVIDLSIVFITIADSGILDLQASLLNC
jgi:hypothetical protein